MRTAPYPSVPDLDFFAEAHVDFIVGVIDEGVQQGMPCGRPFLQ
ncbi:hypothetical protein ACFLQW_03915 [Candidatus Zixiibacteriota bacterium]